MKPYLLSHHPDCPAFANHTFSIGTRKFCIGCFIGYPAAVVGIILGSLLFQFKVLSLLSLGWMGLAFIASLGLSLVGLTHYKPIKMVQKFIYGFGAGVLIFILWIIVGPPWYAQLFFEWIFIAGVNMPISIVHSFSHIRICKKCVQTDCTRLSFYQK